MDRTDYRDKEDIETPDLGPIASFAIVVRMPLASMPDLVHLVERMPGARVVYQRTSAGRLRIIEEER
jgi:hypothetical protein